MSQRDYSIPNALATDVRQDIDLTFKAAASNNSGPTAPTDTHPFMWWADTSLGLIKIRNAANTNWITVGLAAEEGLGLAKRSDRLKHFARVRLNSSLAVASNWVNISNSMTVISDPNSLCNASKTYIPPETGWYEISAYFRVSASSASSTNAAISLGDPNVVSNVLMQTYPALSTVLSFRLMLNKYIVASTAQSVNTFVGIVSGTCEEADVVYRWSPLNG